MRNKATAPAQATRSIGFILGNSNSLRIGITEHMLEKIQHIKNKQSVVHLIVIQLINILLWTPTDYQHLHISLPFDILHSGCPKSLFTWALPTKILYIFLFSAICVTHPTHLIFLSLTGPRIWDYNTNCKASHFCINLLVFLFQKWRFHSLSHNLFRVKYSPCTLSSNILGLYSSFKLNFSPSQLSMVNTGTHIQHTFGWCQKHVPAASWMRMLLSHDPVQYYYSHRW